MRSFQITLIIFASLGTVHYQDRIAKISQKLNNIQSGKDNEKAQKLDANEIKLKQLEGQFFEFQDVLDNRLQGLKENLIKIHHLIDGQKQNREMAFEQKMKEIQQIDQKFTYAIDQETIVIQLLLKIFVKQRKEGESKFIRIINDKSSGIKTEIIKENQVRNENLENLNQCLESDLQKLNEDIKLEAQDRNEMDSSLGKKINEEVQKLNTQITVEKKTREDGEQGIFDMLKDVVNRVKGEIEYERKNREASEETILNLLEETCNKLNVATSTV